MKKFKYVEDVEEWLAPMDYQTFWFVIAPYDLVLQTREHCDREIAEDNAEADIVLEVLKHMAQMELREKLGLKRREVTPWLKLVETH